eukprot:3437657-Pleurochrysis_carterae.AAC.1
MDICLYEEEYLVDYEWWGTSKALSRSRWTDLCDEALMILSAEFFGVEEDGVTPQTLLELKGRPNHSNFGACDECEKAKLAW